MKIKENIIGDKDKIIQKKKQEEEKDMAFKYFTDLTEKQLKKHINNLNIDKDLKVFLKKMANVLRLFLQEK